MSSVTIALPQPEAAVDDYKVVLDESTYIFRYMYNSREDAWHLTITDTNSVVLIDGVKLVPWMDILYSHTRELLPKGSLNLIPLNKIYPEANDIKYDNLSKEYQLLYLSLS